MQVPTRKPGKYTHQKPDPHITEEKLDALKNNLERMKKIRPHLAAEVKRLALDGDFSENAAYSVAKGKLRGLNQKMIETAEQIKNALIIKSGGKKERVGLGCEVVVKIGDKEKTFLILGSAEANPGKNIISANSPVGAALMGKKIGDIARVKLKDKEVSYKIIEIK